MKIIVSISVEFERTDGSYSKITDGIDVHTGDNPRFEGTEALNAIAKATAVISRRLIGEEQ